MDNFESLASEILRKFGADFEAAKRAGGWTNRVWIAGELVLRISPDESGDRIRREAALGARLPKAVGYPEILETGVRDGHEWSVSRRVPGVNLGQAWPNLDWTRREEAMRGLWEIAEAIHEADLRDLSLALPRRTWYSDLRPETAHAGLGTLSGGGALTEAETDALSGILDAFFDALGRAERCLCHGDLTMENMMWDGERIASVFDFEHAALLPAQADVYSFLRLTLGPGDADAPAEFARTITDLARARVRNADGAKLLLGFAALISIRHMDVWDGPEPRLCLASLADGRGGFLAPVVEESLG